MVEEVSWKGKKTVRKKYIGTKETNEVKEGEKEVKSDEKKTDGKGRTS